MTDYFWSRLAILIAVVALLTSIGTCVAHAEAVMATPEGYEWSSNKGALRLAEENKHIYIFDTYKALTIAKDKIVSWNVTKEEDLTDLGKDLKGRLMKINDIGSVFVGYRVIMFKKYNLSRWEDILNSIHKALE